MENNRNWAGIAALVLAGLALLVALVGRGGPSFDFSARVWNGGPGNSTAAPQAIRVPLVPGAGAQLPADPAQAQADAQAKIAQAQADAQAKIAQAQAEAQAKIAQAQGKVPVPPAAVPAKPVPPFAMHGPFGNWASGSNRFGSFVAAPFHILGGLFQLLLFGGLLFLVFRFFRRRQQTFARGPAQNPPPSSGAGPTIQL